MTLDLETVRAKLRAVGLSFAHWYILAGCDYGPKPPKFLIGDAFEEAVNSVLGPVTEVELEQALRACLDQGWARLIDRPGLEEIISTVQRAGLIGPVVRYPAAGDVDFTAEGAARYCQLYQDLFGKRVGLEETFHVAVDCGKQIYCSTLRAAQDEVAVYRGSPGVSAVSAPSLLGPWCVYWWLTFPTGYRVDVQQEQPADSPDEPPQN